MDSQALREKLAKLQQEQSQDAVEGVHYSAMDVAASTEKKAARRSQKHRQAVAFTPRRPGADGEYHEVTPGPVPRNPRLATLAEQAAVVDSVDRSARRHPSMPFALREHSPDAPMGAEMESENDESGADADAQETPKRALKFGGAYTEESFSASQREFHASQQATLNAELRLNCEEGLKAWEAKMTEAKAALLAVVHDGPAQAATGISRLKTYEDNYQCVHPLDDDAVAKSLERQLSLQILSDELTRLNDDLPALDRESIITALDSLKAPFAGVRGVMPAARQKQRHGSLLPLDEVADGATMADAVMREYSDLYADVLAGLRSSLEGSDGTVAEMRITADDAAGKRQEAIREASEQAQRASEPAASHRPKTANKVTETVNAVGKHQLRESAVLSDLVAERATRHELFKMTETDVLEHAASSRRNCDIAAELTEAFERTAADSWSRASSDRGTLSGRAEDISETILSQHRAFIAEQAKAHSTLMELQTKEQSVWAEVAHKVSEALTLAADRRDLMLQRLRAREEEARSQRLLAQQLAMVRRRLVATNNAIRVLDVHREVATELQSYNEAMKGLQAARNVAAEHGDLWRTEAQAALVDYRQALAVSEDLRARWMNRLEVSQKGRREAELDLGMAVECFDPDVERYRKDLETLSETCRDLETRVRNLDESIGQTTTAGAPICELIAKRRWATGTAAREAQHVLNRTLKGDVGEQGQASDDDSDQDDSDNDDPKFAATRYAVRSQLRVQNQALRHRDHEQDAAEAQLTNIRATRADADAARKQHEAKLSQTSARENQPRSDTADDDGKSAAAAQAEAHVPATDAPRDDAPAPAASTPAGAVDISIPPEEDPGADSTPVNV